MYFTCTCSYTLYANKHANVVHVSHDVYMYAHS